MWEAEPNPWASLQPWAPRDGDGDGGGGGGGDAASGDDVRGKGAREARAENAWWLCVAPAGAAEAEADAP